MNDFGHIIGIIDIFERSFFEHVIGDILHLFVDLFFFFNTDHTIFWCISRLSDITTNQLWYLSLEIWLGSNSHLLAISPPLGSVYSFLLILNCLLGLNILEFNLFLIDPHFIETDDHLVNLLKYVHLELTSSRVMWPMEWWRRGVWITTHFIISSKTNSLLENISLITQLLLDV